MLITGTLPCTCTSQSWKEGGWGPLLQPLSLRIGENWLHLGSNKEEEKAKKAATRKQKKDVDPYGWLTRYHSLVASTRFC
jgi:hypothetical protein